MVFFHTIPIQIYTKYRKNMEKAISEIYDEIEILRTIRPLLISFENSISHFNLVSKFVINIEEKEE